MAKVYMFRFEPAWMKLSSVLSRIDRFDAAWKAIERREGQTLKQLKGIATVCSVGASTRIEGSLMTDPEVEALLENLQNAKLEERDQQEVIGYFKTLELIDASWRDIDITEGNIKNLHKQLLAESRKDDWHRGNYKQLSNEVEATATDGRKTTIFRTTEPGLATEEAMTGLVGWYREDRQTLPLIGIAAFVYELLSIHPFQDGNGRLSRLMTTLLLLRGNYSWIQYISFEHEIEARKSEYYRVLMDCQSHRPGEDITPWVSFFLDCLENLQGLLSKKLEKDRTPGDMYPRQKEVYSYIDVHPGAKSGEIAGRLQIPLPTIKRDLIEMTRMGIIVKEGIGAGTYYMTADIPRMREDLMFRLTNSDRAKIFHLPRTGNFLSIKKILLHPLFEWEYPTEWASRLHDEELVLRIVCGGARGTVIERLVLIAAYNSPFNYQPVFTLPSPITAPLGIWSQQPPPFEYPIQVRIELMGKSTPLLFDVTVVYDEA